MGDYKRVNRTLIHKGHIVDFYNDTMQLPDGRMADWDYLHHKGAAAIVPVDAEGKIIMVRQYRNAPERYTLEIPAGGLNSNEDRKEAAMRELEEETGYKAGEVKHLLDLYTSVAFCNEMISIYYTTDITLSKQNLDEDEFVEVERYSVEELVTKIIKGEIQDAKTIAAILAYKEVAK
jgi:ADP-ribose pyrophosphatase